MSEKENQTEFLTQSEVAEFFRVTPGTIHNWRKNGLLGYFQVPSSTRVLYPIADVLKFKQSYTTCPKAGKEVKPTKQVREKLVVSAGPEKEWRI